LHKVTKPELYGVAKVDAKNRIKDIKEKPKKFLSDLAITGLYFFDNKVVKYAKNLKPSKRGEIEIVDLLNKYKKTKIKESVNYRLLNKIHHLLRKGHVLYISPFMKAFQLYI